MPVDFPALHEMATADLRGQARGLGIAEADTARRQDLVFEVGRRLGEKESQTFGRGVLEVHGEGFGFLRSPVANFLPGPDDIYVSQSQIRRFKLQTGDTVIGLVRPPKEGERYLALLRVESVNGEPPGEEPPSFDTLTAIYPDDRIPLDRIPLLKAVDLAAPLGLGQRGLLVAPARTGRVELLRALADLLTVTNRSSSASAPRRSTSGGTRAARRSWRRRSTSRPHATCRSRTSCSSGPDGWSSAATTPCCSSTASRAC